MGSTDVGRLVVTRITTRIARASGYVLPLRAVCGGCRLEELGGGRQLAHYRPLLFSQVGMHAAIASLCTAKQRDQKNRGGERRGVLVGCW